jgi:hypothetical protein
MGQQPTARTEMPEWCLAVVDEAKLHEVRDHSDSVARFPDSSSMTRHKAKVVVTLCVTSDHAGVMLTLFQPIEDHVDVFLPRVGLAGDTMRWSRLKGNRSWEVLR